MRTRIFSSLLSLFILSGYGTSAIAQWQQIPGLSGLYLTCMVTTEDSTILAGGIMGTLLRSTDNGASWESVWGNGISIDTILALGAGRGYIFAAADNPNNVYRSSDDGVNWSLSNSGIPSRVLGFLYVDSALYAPTSYGVYSSTDDGGTWSADTAGLGFDPLYPAPWSISTIAIAHEGNKIIVTKDFAKGLYASATDSIHWTSIGLTNWDISLAGIDTMIFAATSDGVFLYSGSDTTWEERSTGLPSSLSYNPILKAVDSLLFVYTGSFSVIYVSGDLGLHWEVLGTSDLGGSPISSMASTKTHLITETSSNKWRLAVNDIVLSAETRLPGSPVQFGLFQNYPNPFNPETAVSYQLSAVSEVRLGVFDILGREIAVLVNEEKRAGAYSTIWNASSQPSGVYFLRLRAGNLVQTRKMVLTR